VTISDEIMTVNTLQMGTMHLYFVMPQVFQYNV
jgi:hypothetical protein